MSIRSLRSLLAAAALLCPVIPHSSLGQSESEPAPATATKKITARQVLEATFAKTSNAKTVDDFSEIIEQCERVLGVKLSAENSAYAHELAAWGYNRRGEAYAQEAATLAEKGEERKANELDEVALADFEAALAHDPKKWKAVQNRGVSLALRGRIDEAIVDFTRVIELNSKYESAWFNRGELLARQGKFSEAAGDYDEALKLKPDDLGALLGRGNARMRLRKFRSALNDFTRALQIEPQSPHALVGRADIRSEIGQWEDAAEDYRRAIKLSPKFGRAYRGAAWLMATCPEDRFRDAELAVASARQALALVGNGDYAYLDTLAAALANAGEFEDAKAAQEKAIQIAPDAATTELRERLNLYRSDRPYRTTSRTAKGEDAVEMR